MPHHPTLHRSAKNLLTELLDEPALDRWVRELPAPTWKALIRHIGLEDSSELLALSTPEQLVELVDETLWDNQDADQFDVERFATLLESLHDAGVRTLSDKVAGLPEEFLTMALSRLISVWPADYLRRMAESDESGVLDKRLEGDNYEEFDEYAVLSPSGLAWDAIVELLSIWSDAQPELMERLLHRLSQSNVNSIDEPDELVSVLDEMAEFEDDARGEREERRAASGYISASDALAFLRMPPPSRPGETDAISSAYFRRLRPPKATSPEENHRLHEVLRRFVPLDPGITRRQLTTGTGLLKGALEELARASPESHARALEELAFLTNVLVAASSRKRSPDAPPDVAEAIRSVVTAVEAGALQEIGLPPEIATEKLRARLEAEGPISLFRKRPH